MHVDIDCSPVAITEWTPNYNTVVTRGQDGGGEGGREGGRKGGEGWMEGRRGEERRGEEREERRRINIPLVPDLSDKIWDEEVMSTSPTTIDAHPPTFQSNTAKS